jgi:protein-tyrosine phosphatase
VLLRSDNLQDLSPADVERLVGELGVRTVLDLRSSGEVHLTGPGPLREAGPVHHQLTLIRVWDGEPDRDEVDRALDDATQDKALPSLPPGPRQQGPTDLGDHYGDYIAKAGTNLGRALRILADADGGATLVHCAAGKDRTGVVVALALSLVGVRRDAVIADYLLSAERADRILARLKATSAYGPSLARTTVADITPVAASMEHFLDAVDREHGGPHGLALSLGVDEEAVARLGARLVGTSALAR